MEEAPQAAGELEISRHLRPPSYPPVVVVDSSVGVVPPLSSGLLSQAATINARETTIAPIARRDFLISLVTPLVVTGAPPAPSEGYGKTDHLSIAIAAMRIDG